MKIVLLPIHGLLGLGPYVQFTDEEHRLIDEALAQVQRDAMVSTSYGVVTSSHPFQYLQKLRDSLNPVWMLVKDGAGIERKGVIQKDGS